MILSFFVPPLSPAFRTTHTNTRVTCFQEGQLKSGDIHSLVFTAIFLWRREREDPKPSQQGVGREGGGAADSAKSELDGRGVQAAAAAGKALPVFRNAAWRERACDRAVNPMREKTRKSRLYSAPPLSPSRVNARELNTRIRTDADSSFNQLASRYLTSRRRVYGPISAATGRLYQRWRYLTPSPRPTRFML